MWQWYGHCNTNAALKPWQARESPVRGSTSICLSKRLLVLCICMFSHKFKHEVWNWTYCTQHRRPYSSFHNPTNGRNSSVNKALKLWCYTVLASNGSAYLQRRCIADSVTWHSGLPKWFWLVNRSKHSTMNSSYCSRKTELTADNVSFIEGPNVVAHSPPDATCGT